MKVAIHRFKSKSFHDYDLISKQYLMSEKKIIWSTLIEFKNYENEFHKVWVNIFCTSLFVSIYFSFHSWDK